MNSSHECDNILVTILLFNVQCSQRVVENVQHEERSNTDESQNIHGDVFHSFLFQVLSKVFICTPGMMVSLKAGG